MVEGSGGRVLLTRVQMKSLGAVWPDLPRWLLLLEARVGTPTADRVGTLLTVF